MDESIYILFHCVKMEINIIDMIECIHDIGQILTPLWLQVPAKSFPHQKIE